MHDPKFEIVLLSYLFDTEEFNVYSSIIIYFPSPLSFLQFHVDHSRAHFYVDDSPTATALQKCSHKITDSDGYKVC